MNIAKIKETAKLIASLAALGLMILGAQYLFLVQLAERLPK
jgi:hypothetical protein